MKGANRQPKDPQLLRAGVALQRAALKAHELARQTGTACYIWENGRVVNIADRPIDPDYDVRVVRAGMHRGAR